MARQLDLKLEPGCQCKQNIQTACIKSVIINLYNKLDYAMCGVCCIIFLIFYKKK